MKILITGIAGFIGFHLANKLLISKKIKVYGIDNFDNYYSIKLKKKRLAILKNKKNFFFEKIDISSSKVKKYLFKKKFDIVIHLAAQAGVRYSVTNPEKYLNTNIIAFSNIFENIDKTNLKKVIYASSSSVYGDTKKFPTTENHNTNPKNIYGYSKVINEHMSEYYSNKLNLPFIGIRFFTVYGTWGRPDMFILKVLNSHFEKKVFNLNNNGNHLRDFTSVNDVVKILIKLINKNITSNKIFNICSNKPILIKDILKKIQSRVGKINYKNVKRNNADVLNTHGNNKKILNEVKFKKFASFYSELEKILEWHQKIKNKKYF